MDEELIGQLAHGLTDSVEGDRSSADGYLIWPTGIPLNILDMVYLVDEWLNRISIFTKDGEYVTKWGRLGCGAGVWSKPPGLAINKDDNLYWWTVATIESTS